VVWEGRRREALPYPDSKSTHLGSVTNPRKRKAPRARRGQGTNGGNQLSLSYITAKSRHQPIPPPPKEKAPAENQLSGMAGAEFVTLCVAELRKSSGND
jgi:hypothetical protein